MLDGKAKFMERNVNVVNPEKIRENSEKIEQCSQVLNQKDMVIEQILNEISLVKNEKDDLQNAVLFKKQRIDNLNIGKIFIILNNI